jgi:hypothetical protein
VATLSDQMGSLSFAWREGTEKMGTILLFIVIVLLIGTGGGFYGYRQYGGPGLGGAIVLVLIIILVLWVAGGFHLNG